MEGTITALEPVRRRPHRLRLCLDGRCACEVSVSVAVAHGLQPGMYLSAETAALIAAEERAAAMQAALRLLSQRDRSVAEVRRRLQARGCAAEVVNSVVARLTDLGYLDDAAFAQRWVESRQRTRPSGARRLRAELAQKGVARGTAEQAIAAAAGDEYAQARAAAATRLSRLAAADFPTFARRLGGFLTRRGFAAHVVYEVVRDLWAERGHSLPDMADDP